MISPLINKASQGISKPSFGISKTSPGTNSAEFICKISGISLFSFLRKTLISQEYFDNS